ncbi:MAG TPA: AAA family ATPase [Acidimicrobiales bacterium]
MPHPDLAAEQAHVDHAYDRLEAMRAAALDMLYTAFGERGGTFQAATERDIMVRTSLNRLEQLQIGGESLVFGRIDRLATDAEGDATREAFHIGRLAISDTDQEPLVVDWRAPVAEPFYRATGAHPMDLTRRRHFLTEGRHLLDLEDELFGSAEESPDGALGAGLSGSAVLLAALERSRSGRMRDIVATVQREQDEIIRGPLAGILVVQGGPGTGKTAVALHRAAYLLYTHRFPLEQQGVLVVGPNPLFLRYIEHVLPSLGETGVELSTVGGLFGDAVSTGRDTRAAARLKGDARMARVVARAVADRERSVRQAVSIPFGQTVLSLSRRASSDIVSAVKRRSGPHNARRRQVEALLWRHLHDQYLARLGRLGGPVPESGLEASDLGREVRRRPEVVEILERMWPVLTPQQLLRDLFGAAPLLDLAGRDLLSDGERQLLQRDPGPGPDAVAWTDADLALLDEARAVLGPPRRQPSDDDRPRSYGHIVVDEAQELSPMQLRMLARRSLSGSMTIVGDVAQATGEWAPGSWDEVLAHLPTHKGNRVTELTVNYRTPSEIMELAGRVLAVAAPGMSAPEAVRTTGVLPWLLQVDEARLAQAVARVARDESAVVSGESAAGGRVAIICPPSSVDALSDALVELDVPFGTPAAGALDDLVSLIPVESVKGLEFDSVIVVDPAGIVAESAQGLRSLYVALTRATRRVALVYSGALPPPLDG